MKSSGFRSRWIALLAMATVGVSSLHAQDTAATGEWRAYGADKANTKYSPLEQIHRGNVGDLEVAWRWRSPGNDLVKINRRWLSSAFEATPLMIDGVLYVSTPFSQIAAIDAESGKQLWLFDPEAYKAGRPTNLGFIHRGVAYWKDGAQERIFIGTSDARLIAIDARTGRRVAEFGDGGEVDLTQGLRRPVQRRYYTISSPPVVCRDVVVVGSSIFDGPTRKEMPPGDVRGFDARTGKQLWSFHSVAQEGEEGNETWEERSWEYTGNTNVWTLMSADEELGYVYLPFGTPTNDWYGGHRKGNNLFAESLVCLDAATGRKIWHFQMVHHGLWDYDLPAAPNLVDITVDGRKIKAVAQVSKQAFCYVFDRETGEPVWPIEEKAVPQSSLEGEKTSPTQPFPSKPLAFDRQGITEDDVIDFTPELRAEGLEILGRYDHGPIFTPPSERGLVMLPGWIGGANWSGAAFDPETSMLYVPSITAPILVTLVRPDANRSNVRFIRSGTLAAPGPQGLPLFKPPYSRVTAIDLNSGEHRWMTPVGAGPRGHKLLAHLDLPPLGNGTRGFPLLTKSLLFVAQESGFTRGDHIDPAFREDMHDLLVEGGNEAFRPYLYAYDKGTGELIASIELPGYPGGAPMTYRAGARQYIVVAVGGGPGREAELVALALPRRRGTSGADPAVGF